MRNRSLTVLDSSAGGKKTQISCHLNLQWWLGLFLVRFKTDFVGPSQKEAKNIHFRSDLNDRRQRVKKNKQISSHLNLLWWLGLFLVMFKTEIMSVLAKTKWKISISASIWTIAAILHNRSFTVPDISAGGEKNPQISSHLNLLWSLGLFLVMFRTEIMSVLAKKNRKRSIFP